MVVILKVILELAGDCSNYSHNQCSPYSEYGSYTQVILELAGDCNNYSHNQRSPYFEYGIYSHTQCPHTYE